MTHTVSSVYTRLWRRSRPPRVGAGGEFPLPDPPPGPTALLTLGSEAGSGPPVGACPSLPAPSAGSASSASVKGTVGEVVTRPPHPPSRRWGPKGTAPGESCTPVLRQAKGNKPADKHRGTSGALRVGEQLFLLKRGLRPEALRKRPKVGSCTQTAAPALPTWVWSEQVCGNWERGQWRKEVRGSKGRLAPLGAPRVQDVHVARSGSGCHGERERGHPAVLLGSGEHHARLPLPGAAWPGRGPLLGHTCLASARARGPTSHHGTADRIRSALSSPVIRRSAQER